MKLYAWITDEGGVAYGRTIPDVPYIEVDTLPDAPQEEWSIVDGRIVVDEAKRIPSKLKALEVAVQKHLDATASAQGYDNIISACSYAGFDNPFQAEGQQFISWRGAVWATCYDMVNKWQSGILPEPTEQEVIDSLPVYGAK
jgi:hypothetical protein